MGRQQIWCAAGHYQDWNLTSFHEMSGVTCEGEPCLVKGCTAKIVVRNFVEGKDQKGYIHPRTTDQPNDLQEAELRKAAAELREQASALEVRADGVRLFAIPNPDTDRTVIDPEGFLDWYRRGSDLETAPRIPYQCETSD